MSQILTLRPLSPADVEAYRSIRLLALQNDPTAFGSSYEENVHKPLNHFSDQLEQRPDNLMLGAFSGTKLQGVVGVVRESGNKSAHKAFIRAMFVRPEIRNRGIGKQLFAAIVDAAAQSMPGLRQLTLTVEAENTAALRLYQQYGFVAYGREPGSLYVNGQYRDEILMIKILHKDNHHA